MSPTGVPDRQHAAIDCQLVIHVARFQGLDTGHSRDVGQRDSGQRRQRLSPLRGKAIYLATTAPAGAPMQGLGPHHPSFPTQSLQADLAGPWRGGFEGQGPEQDGRQQAMGVEQAQTWSCRGPTRTRITSSGTAEGAGKCADAASARAWTLRELTA